MQSCFQKNISVIGIAKKNNYLHPNQVTERSVHLPSKAQALFSPNSSSKKMDRKLLLFKASKCTLIDHLLVSVQKQTEKHKPDCASLAVNGDIFLRQWVRERW